MLTQRLKSNRSVGNSKQNQKYGFIKMPANKKKPNVVFHTEHKGAWVHQALKEGMSFILWLEKVANAACNDEQMPEWLQIFTQSTARQIMASGIKSFEMLTQFDEWQLMRMGFKLDQIEEINEKL